MLAILPTLIAVVAGVVLGVSGGGRLDRLLRWRPALWQAGVFAVAVQLLFRLLPLSGGVAVFLDVVSVVAALVFCGANIRVPGMVVIVVALALHAVPVVVNWGMPVRAGALVSAGLVEEDQLDSVELEGPRHIQDEDDRLGFLGETIPLPIGQVLALADVVGLVGLALVISALMRGRRIGATSAGGRARRGSRRGPVGGPRSPRSRRPPTPPPARSRRPARDVFELSDSIDLRDPPIRRR